MQRPGPHGVAIASQYIYFLCDKCAGRWRSVRVVSFNNFFNGQKSWLYLCFLEPYGPKLQLPWLKQTLDIPTPEYNPHLLCFLWGNTFMITPIVKSKFRQEICHPLKLHKIQIAKKKKKKKKKKLNTSH